MRETRRIFGQPKQAIGMGPRARLQSPGPVADQSRVSSSGDQAHTSICATALRARKASNANALSLKDTILSLESVLQSMWVYQKWLQQMQAADVQLQGVLHFVG